MIWPALNAPPEKGQRTGAVQSATARPDPYGTSAMPRAAAPEGGQNQAGIVMAATLARDGAQSAWGSSGQRNYHAASAAQEASLCPDRRPTSRLHC